MIDKLLCAKLPPLLSGTINLAQLENRTYDRTVAHLEREIELSGLETDEELPIPTLVTKKTALNKPNPSEKEE